MNAIYDEAAAKVGIEKMYTDLQALNTTLDAAITANALTAEAFQTHFDAYNAYPQGHDVNWGITQYTKEQAHELANDVRGKLQQLTGIIGVNKHIPRLFNQ